MEQDKLAEMDCHIEVMEALHLFLEEIVENYTEYGIGNNSKQFQTTTLKLVTLARFMQLTLEDMHKTMDELLK